MIFLANKKSLGTTLSVERDHRPLVRKMTQLTRPSSSVAAHASRLSPNLSWPRLTGPLWRVWASSSTVPGKKKSRDRTANKAKNKWIDSLTNPSKKVVVALKTSKNTQKCLVNNPFVCPQSQFSKVPALVPMLFVPGQILLMDPGARLAALLARADTSPARHVGRQERLGNGLPCNIQKNRTHCQKHMKNRPTFLSRIVFLQNSKIRTDLEPGKCTGFRVYLPPPFYHHMGHDDEG